MPSDKKHTRRISPKPRKHQKEYFLWCDESDRKGKYFSNFYGGVLVRSEHLQEVHKKLLATCKKLNLNDEIKWHKVSGHYLDKYKKIMDVFLGLVEQEKIKVRIMFSQNAFVPVNLTERHKLEEFFILYYHSLSMLLV